MANGEAGSPRARQRNRQRRVANELGIDASQVAVRDTLDRGTRATLTSDGVGAAEQAARSRVAESADYVRSDDVASDVGRRSLSVSTRVTDREDVAQRATSEMAADMQFVNAADLDAEVGERGVSDVFIAERRRGAVGQRAAADAAEDAEFVTAEDLSANVTDSGVAGVSIAEERKDDVAERAETEFASESEFITPSDVDADVGERGVSEVAIPEERQDDVESRVESDLLSQIGDSARPSDVSVRVTDSGIQEADLADGAAQQIAARDFQSQFADGETDPTKQDLRQFAQANFEGASSDDIDQFVSRATQDDQQAGTGEFALGADGPVGQAVDLRNAVRNDETVDAGNFAGVYDVDIGVGDVERTGDGFSLSGPAQRRVAADQIEESTPLSGLDPLRDVTRQDGGFGLAGSAQREYAAEQFEQETALEEINPNVGLTRTNDGFGLSTPGQRQLAAQQFEEQTELSEVDPQQDILLNDDGSATLADQTEKELAAELLDQQVDADVGVDDIDRVTDPGGDTEFEFVGGGR